MKFLVFGAGGFLGSRLVEGLEGSGHEVTAVHRSGHQNNVDIRRLEDFEKLSSIPVPDIIVNCASVLPGQPLTDPSYLRSLFEVNVSGAANIMQFARARGIRRVINCSTLAVTGKPWPVPLTEKTWLPPSGPHAGYASSKLSQELVMNELAGQSGISLLHLRLSALYGPGMKWAGILPTLIDRAIKNDRIQLTNGGRVSFDFLWVDDLVKAIMAIAEKTEWSHGVVNAASGEETGLRSLAEMVVRASGSASEIENKEGDEAESRAVVDVTLWKELTDNLRMTPLAKGIEILVEQKKRLY
jgi:UDP-glucose 4-epimerase